jgi:SpoVK/Ycf46/Vps4 family AAA+-type ATPase
LYHGIPESSRTPGGAPHASRVRSAPPLWRPPGGGKTQYALWLAKRLGRDVVLKRPAELLYKYVGESEQQIAAAFRAAEQAGSVLVIDEAAALLYDRSIAQRSWEHSQIAEFLQQIQEFSGILIACTNRVDAVDPALRRRFHKHVTFGPVSDEVLPRALAHIFPEIAFTDADLVALRQGPPLMMSDLATAAEMMEIEGPGGSGFEDEA